MHESFFADNVANFPTGTDCYMREKSSVCVQRSVNSDAASSGHHSSKLLPFSV